MKILYRQSSKKQEESQRISHFRDYGIQNCYLKSIEQRAQDGSSTKKRHSHTGYEFHIILSGEQRYETTDGDFSVKGGCFLAIPKGRTHRFVSAAYPTEKYAVTFSLDDRAEDIFDGLDRIKCICKPVPDRILSNIRAVSEQLAYATTLSAQIIENCVFETVILLLREMGTVEKSSASHICGERSENERVELARQFISDNVESPLQVSEVAAYCHISEKQLTRLFYFSERLTPAAYIRRQRIKHIEELLRSPELTLYEISRRMGFPNESGFNAFFKKYNGMPPGEYRKMITNGRA